jgi:hypothetical protein
MANSSILNFDTERLVKHKHNNELPDCHYLIVGRTGSGKTNLLMNLLLAGNFNYDRVYIYTINPQQDKYELLSNYNDKLRDDLETGEDFFIIRQPEDLIPVNQLDADEHKIVVFDDIPLNNKEMEKIRSYFSLSRNKLCNSIYLAQGYYNVDRFIRRNTGCFILFPGLDNVDVRNIAYEQCGDVTKDKFIELYRNATKDKYNFFLFDKFTNDPNKMFRCCIDTYLR